MIYNNADMLDALTAPVRNIGFSADIYTGDTFSTSYNSNDKIVSLTVERVGEDSKFFGYGVCQKLNLKLIDTNRDIDISTANNIEINYTYNEDKPYYYYAPKFYVTDVFRDENTNELSITGYDLIYKEFSSHTVGELGLESYSISTFLLAVANLLGIENVLTFGFSLFDNYVYAAGANFDGSETIREALNAIAEASQTIYYIDYSNSLCFSRFSNEDAAVFTITKSDYIDLDTGDNRRLSTIVHATELGDNVSATTGVTGTTQYIRNNPFWDLRDDIADLVDEAITNVGGLTINQFVCEWRGYPDIQVGDKIALETKTGDLVYGYMINDTLTYDGTLSQKTMWKYEADENETADNPTSLGDIVKQTYARVDKAEKQINLLASETTSNGEKIAALQVNTGSISASVTDIEQHINEAIDAINGDIETITSKVEATMTAEDVTIAIQTEVANGVDKVTTSTGFTFNEEGLTVSKTDSEIETTITEDGMTISKNDETVLTANNEGVKAQDLHATTYLIIGTNSRFENYGDSRTGCFWIGG